MALNFPKFSDYVKYLFFHFVKRPSLIKKKRSLLTSVLWHITISLIPITKNCVRFVIDFNDASFGFSTHDGWSKTDVKCVTIQVLCLMCSFPWLSHLVNYLKSYIFYRHVLSMLKFYLPLKSKTNEIYFSDCQHLKKSTSKFHTFANKDFFKSR